MNMTTSKKPDTFVKSLNLENLTPANLEKIFHILQAIDEKFQLHPTPNVKIDFPFRHWRPTESFIEAHTDGTGYLISKGVILTTRFNFDHGMHYEVLLNIPKFQLIKKVVFDLYRKRKGAEATKIACEELGLNHKATKETAEKQLIVAKKDDIMLDKHIALREKGKTHFLLFWQEKNMRFSEIVPISPQIYKIVRHLYQIRNNADNAKTPAELWNQGFAQHRSTISNRLSEINKICRKHKITSILHPFPSDKWGLNPKLTSCKA